MLRFKRFPIVTFKGVSDSFIQRAFCGGSNGAVLSLFLSSIILAENIKMMHYIKLSRGVYFVNLPTRKKFRGEISEL